MSKLCVSGAPPPPSPEFWVKRLAANESWFAVVLSDGIFGVTTHWAGSYSIPCVEPVERCRGHIRGYPTRWRGYIHCWSLHDQRHEILEITPATANCLLAQVGASQSLRGNRIVFKRVGGKTSKVQVQFELPWERYSQQPLPAARDVQASLWNVWKKALKAEGGCEDVE